MGKFNWKALVGFIPVIFTGVMAISGALDDKKRDEQLEILWTEHQLKKKQKEK